MAFGAASFGTRGLKAGSVMFLNHGTTKYFTHTELLCTATVVVFLTELAVCELWTCGIVVCADNML